MITGSHKRLTAWLGLIAMLLVVVMPIASRFIHTSPHSRDLVIPICSVADQARQHGAASYSIHVDGGHDSPASSLNACGYCSLFAYTAVLLSAPPAAPIVLLLALILLTVPRRTRFTPCGAFPSGRPRDPPRIS